MALSDSGRKPTSLFRKTWCATV